MSIYLPAPSYRPGGPDGNGWNRLSVSFGASGGQCALKPQTYAALSGIRRGSDFTSWGGHGRCVREGATWANSGAGPVDCTGCPVLAAWRDDSRRELVFGQPTALVRLEERWNEAGTVLCGERPHVMDRPDGGWGETSLPYSWWELARLQGWRVGRRHRDEHSDGFWLHATTGRNGIYGDPRWEPVGATR